MQALIIIAFGFSLLYIAFKFRANTKKIAINGIETEGIVFDLIQSDTLEGKAKFPLIRFVTSEQVWITEKYNISSIVGSFRKGQKVTVVYNASNPKEFFVKSQTTSLVPTLAIVFALVVIGIGV